MSGMPSMEVLVTHKVAMLTVRDEMLSDCLDKRIHCMAKFPENHISNEDTFARQRRPNGPHCVQLLEFRKDLMEGCWL